jgi:transcriptional regulator with XRE-family HTH domain
MSDFGINLRKRAQELGISNAEVARRANLDTSRYGHYVSGRTEPDLATLARIAKVLDTTPNVLLGFEDGPDGEDITRARLNSALSALNDRDREIVTACAEAIVGLRER